MLGWSFACIHLDGWLLAWLATRFSRNLLDTRTCCLRMRLSLCCCRRGGRRLAVTSLLILLLVGFVGFAFVSFCLLCFRVVVGCVSVFRVGPPPLYIDQTNEPRVRPRSFVLVFICPPNGCYHVDDDDDDGDYVKIPSARLVRGAPTSCPGPSCGCLHQHWWRCCWQHRSWVA